MIKNGPKITVLIPVKNRIKYLRQTLKTCTTQDYDNWELIIADDFSDDPIRDLVQDLARQYTWIKYVKPPLPGGMRNNFEFALSLVTDGYVMFLGSDDGLIPGAIAAIADRLCREKIDLMCWDPAIYYYPGVRNASGQIVLPNKEIRSGFIDSAKIIESLASTLNYLAEPRVPMIYVKGIASVSLINSIRSMSFDHRFFQCATPDGFSGITLLGYCNKVYYSTDAFTIYGSSSESQGSAYLSNTKTAKSISDEFFRQSQQSPMHRDLGSAPYSPLITLMTADYLLRAADQPGWRGMIKLDYRRLIVFAIKELSHGLHAPERVVREMKIIQVIASHHNLNEVFVRSANNIRKKLPHNPYMGDGFNRKSIFLNCAHLDIAELLDAASFSKNIRNLRRAATIKRVLKSIFESIRYKYMIGRNGDRMTRYNEDIV